MSPASNTYARSKARRRGWSLTATRRPFRLCRQTKNRCLIYCPDLEIIFVSILPILVKPGARVNLSLIDPEGTPTISKDAAKYRLDKLQKRLLDLQTRLYAEGKQSLLVILQAMDAGGKDGTIKNVF